MQTYHGGGKKGNISAGDAPPPRHKKDGGCAGPAPPVDTRPEANILFTIEAKRITLGPGYLRAEGTSPLVTFVDRSSGILHTGVMSTDYFTSDKFRNSAGWLEKSNVYAAVYGTSKNGTYQAFAASLDTPFYKPVEGTLEFRANVSDPRTDSGPFQGGTVASLYKANYLVVPTTRRVLNMGAIFIDAHAPSFGYRPKDDIASKGFQDLNFGR
eukprot:jgi/Botrbrau1/12789/Bobra.117_1s0008.1